MNLETVTPAVIVSALLSVVLEWFPVLRAWFESLTSLQKASLNGLLIVIVSVFSVLGNCYWWGSTCPANWWEVIGGFLITALLSVAGNQSIHKMTKRELIQSDSSSREAKSW